uniref:pre-mRNA 3'-end-processing factor FIP1 n=1 Tax=Scatophagus argus TaxID=75038 RepID=UPI001ED85856|nr:pre-mRNA 3'-end-processing factor FIP1 [Scatophagus argus]
MNTKEDKEEKEKVQVSPSSGPTPVHLTMNAEGANSEHKATHNTTRAQRQDDQEVDNTKGPDVNKVNRVREVNADEKPWRKAGANISDYFNYGFDEESWSTYCKKQSKLRSANRKLCTEITVQKGHTRHESCSAHPPSGSPSIPPSRQSSVARDVTYGQDGPSRGVEKCHSVEGSSTQVAEVSKALLG